MGRLVDIDEVIRVAENTFPKEDVRKIMWVLCHTPTAYDVEKVVAELDNAESVKVFGSLNSGNRLIPVSDAIDIVKRGGVE